MKKFKIHKINFLIAPLFVALISCGKTDTNTNSAADEVTNNEEEPSEDPLGGEEDPKQRLLRAVKENKPQLFNVTLEGNPGLKEDKPFLGKALLLAVEPHKDGKPSEDGKLSQHKKYMAEILLRCLGDGPESAKLTGKSLVKLAKQKNHRDMGRDLIAFTFAYNDMQNCGEDIGEALIEFCKKDDKNHFVCESVARLCENRIPYKKSLKAIEAALAREVKNGEAHITLEELKIVEAVLKGIGRHGTMNRGEFDTLLAEGKMGNKFLCRLASELFLAFTKRNYDSAAARYVFKFLEDRGYIDQRSEDQESESVHGKDMDDVEARSVIKFSKSEPESVQSRVSSEPESVRRVSLAALHFALFCLKDQSSLFDIGHSLLIKEARKIEKKINSDLESKTNPDSKNYITTVII